MIRRRQFSLRSVFFAVSVCALFLLLWRNRPPPTLRVELTAQGTTFVDDDEIKRSSLRARIDREALVRRIWRVEPVMILRADASVSQQDFVEVITMSQRAGIQKTTLTADEQSAAQ